MRPHDSSVCLAISMEAEVSTPRSSVNVDPARVGMEHHRAIVDTAYRQRHGKHSSQHGNLPDSLTGR
jgi:hypothetical protein